MHEHREVRVTARESVRTPFVAPELSSPRVIDLELEKGLQGWTDFDVKVEDVTTMEHKPSGLAAKQLEEIAWGRAIRKASTPKRVVSSTGPNAHHKAMRARAAALAAR